MEKHLSLIESTIKILIAVGSIAFSAGMAISGYMSKQERKNEEQDQRISKLENKFHAPSEQIAFYSRQFDICHKNLNEARKAAHNVSAHHQRCLEREKSIRYANF